MNFKPDGDGLTHINIYSKGKTELGRLLSNFAFTPVVLEEGRFASIEGYWFYLGTIHPMRETLRGLTGFNAKKTGSDMRLEAPSNIDQELFQKKIKKGLRAKISQHPEIATLLRKSDLPLIHMYIQGNDYTFTSHAWQVEELEGIRQELKEGKII